MNNKKFTYNDLIKKYTNLTPLEKFINFGFYSGEYWAKYDFKNTGNVILLNEDQKDLTFDDLNNYSKVKGIYSNDQYRDRNFEIVKEKFTNNISNSKLAEKYGLSTTRVSAIYRKIHRIFIGNGKHTDISKIEDIKEEPFTFYMHIYIEERKVHDDDIIDACGFSLPLNNALRRAQIKYVKELKKLKADELRKIRNVGTRKIIELVKRCEELNIELDESIYNTPEVRWAAKLVDEVKNRKEN